MLFCVDVSQSGVERAYHKHTFEMAQSAHPTPTQHETMMLVVNVMKDGVCVSDGGCGEI